MTADERFMQLAIAQARRGLGRTHPNPAVGAVIVKGGKVVAKGFHAKAGLPHAEVVALKAAGAKAKGAVLYSTLEPCGHHGRTPPCSEAILAAGVKEVVYASSDPNPLVSGKGTRRLKRGGVKVRAGVLKAEADALNQPFFTFMKYARPFVTLKAAVTLDGKLATATGDSKWISGEASRRRVHEVRDQVDAILVGAGTVAFDDPQLTTRLPGKQGRSPVRVILDGRLDLDPRARVFEVKRGGPRTIVVTAEPASSPKAKRFNDLGVDVWHVPGEGPRVDLESVLLRLGAAGLLHVLVEGGSQIYGAFLASGLWDELKLFVAPKLFGHGGVTWSGGLSVPQVKDAPALRIVQLEQVGDDVLLTARPADRR